MTYKPLDRRTFLRGAGVTIALPFLEAMLPIYASAATAGAPQRFVGMMFANGCIWANDMNNWMCQGSGTNWTFGRALQTALAPYKSYITPVNGLRNNSYYDLRVIDANISHWAASPTFLTGQPYDYRYRTSLRLLNPGASIDQMIAANTPNNIKSLVMGLELANNYVNEPFYVSEHQVTQISYSSQTTQPEKLDNSLKVFNLLFSGGGGMLPPTGQPGNTVSQRRKSIIDLVKDDVNSLMRKISGRDKLKMDEYFTSLSELEKGIQSEISMSSTGGGGGGGGGSCKPTDPKYTSDNDTKNGSYFAQRSRNMLDMLVIAFQCDLTRVGSMELNNENGEFDMRYYDNAPGTCGHHAASHYRSSPDGTSGAANPDRVNWMDFKNNWEAKQLGYLLGKLQTTSDAYGPLIENTLCLFGCGFSDGANHSGDNLPILLAGRGGGHNAGSIVSANGQNHANLLAAIAQRFGVGSRVGTSTGIVSGI